METVHRLLRRAWWQLLAAYVFAAAIGLVAGNLLIKYGGVQPERVFEVSSTRLSVAFPVFEAGTRYGIDLGILLFVWNALGALVTMSFIHAAPLFNPDRMDMSPRGLRKVFCGQRRMKLLGRLPGCAMIDAEPLRRLYVWTMIPLLGIILLGIESGLQVAGATYLSGSFIASVIAFIPHGLVEIPTFALAGAVTYSGNLLIKASVPVSKVPDIFSMIESHRHAMPSMRIALIIIGGLGFAGMIEAHVTPHLINML